MVTMSRLISRLAKQCSKTSKRALARTCRSSKERPVGKQHEATAKQIVTEHSGAMVYGANFSIGVNLFYRIAETRGRALRCRRWIRAVHRRSASQAQT